MMSSSVNKFHNTVEPYINIVSDKLAGKTAYHLGKMILKTFKEHPNRIMQIDKLTGESESVQSFHDRTVRAALMMCARGLRTGDIVGVIGPNHLDLAVPFIACLYDGLSACPIEETWTYKDFDASLQVIRPKMIFCQSARAVVIHKVITANDIDCEIITFDDNNLGYETIRGFLQSVKDVDEINNFEAANFDTCDTTAVMMTTSGSTGPPKSVCMTHKAFVHQIGFLMSIFRYVGEDRSCALLSPLYWSSGALTVMISCLFAFTRFQISVGEYTVKQVMEMVHIYKPKFCILTPSLARMLLRDSERNTFDFTSLQVNLVVGAHVTVTELQIVDVDSGIENGPNVPGELWVKGPTLFKEYYGNSEATKEAFSVDGFLKTGDMLYKDENDNYFFVDRLKMTIKYKTHLISPVELENLIKQHPGVKEVSVVGVMHVFYGDIPTACIVRTAPDSVTEDEIHELVRKNMPPSHRLHGGVLFMDKLMMTSTYKIDRRNLKLFAEERVDLSTLKIVD